MNVDGSVRGDSCKQFLEKVVAVERTIQRHGINGYCSVEDFVLRNGKAWPVSQRPVCLKIGPLGECFRTSASYALRWPDLYIYCEGFACGSLPVMHAWLLDDQGRVIETTWRDRGVDYFGIALRPEYLEERLCEQKSYGLIDQPTERWPMLRARPEAWRHQIMEL